MSKLPNGNWITDGTFIITKLSEEIMFLSKISFEYAKILKSSSSYSLFMSIFGDGWTKRDPC